MTEESAKEKRKRIQAEKFYHHAITYLRDEFAEATKDKSDEEMKDAIYDGFVKASKYNIETEVDVMGFIDLQWRISTDFDTDEETAWAAEILDDNDTDADMKIAALRNAYALNEALKVENG